MPKTSISIRRGNDGDIRACLDVLWASVTDFGARSGTPLDGMADEWWEATEPLQRYLAAHAAEWWVAEHAGSGDLVGFARSIERGGLLELTEFFVRPENQGGGLGRALMEHAFPSGRGKVRSIIATRDVRALSLYYAAGTVLRFPVLTLTGTPAGVPPGLSLAADPMSADQKTQMRAVRAIERSVLGFPRSDAELRWILGDREGFLYRRGDATAGFAFVGRNGSGPIAALDPADLPEILLHVEGRAHELGIERIGFEVPTPNEIATRHLLSRGYRFDPWVNFLLSNRAFGKFDRFIPFGPPVFL